MHRIISFFSLLILVCCTGAQSPSTIPFVEIQKSESITPTPVNLPVRVDLTTYPVTVDYSMLLVDMINTGRYDITNPKITQGNFPMYEGAGYWPYRKVSVELHLIHFDYEMTSKQVLDNLDERRLRPATLPELCTFGAIYPELQMEFSIAALGSEWRDFLGILLVPALNGGDGKRKLSLDWRGPQDGWRDDCRFLAVSK